MDVTDVLSRLSKVKTTGRDKWIACCPAHADKTPSLTIRALPDGRILLHDFGGCEVLSVLDAIGLEMTDLFPAPMYHRAKPVRHGFSSHDALTALRREVGIVTLAAAEIAEGVAMSLEDRIRFALAADRIEEAATYVNAL